MTETICFYKTRDPHGYMSNFSRHSFVVNGVTYRTSEHFYQSQKFAGTPYEVTVREIASPKDSADLGRSPSLPLRSDWEEIKVEVMRQALIAKFSQNPEIKAQLLSTGDAILVEDSMVDAYWGWGADHSGKNMLGKLLMEVREMFRAEQAAADELTAQAQELDMGY